MENGMTGLIFFVAINAGLGAACLVLNKVLSAITDKMLQ